MERKMKRKIATIVLTLALIVSLAPTTIATADSEIPVHAPENVTAKAKKNGKIAVRWDAATGATSYEVYRSTKVDGEYKRIKTTKKTKYNDKKIRPKKTYFYKVTAKNTSYSNYEISTNTSQVVSAKLKIKKSFKVKAYSYTGGGITKTGKKAKVGRIAVDPKVIKLGTWLYVEGYGICQASDIGSNIKGKTIDVYKNTTKQALKWGVRKPRVYILG